MVNVKSNHKNRFGTSGAETVKGPLAPLVPKGAALRPLPIFKPSPNALLDDPLQRRLCLPLGVNENIHCGPLLLG